MVHKLRMNIAIKLLGWCLDIMPRQEFRKKLARFLLKHIEEIE